MITGNRNVDFGSVGLFEVNDGKIINDEKVVNAITCDFPCKILKNFIVDIHALTTAIFLDVASNHNIAKNVNYVSLLSSYLP